MDVQDVTPSVPTPMTGFGLYYKHRDDEHAGYLGLKLKTYDLTHAVYNAPLIMEELLAKLALPAE